MLFKRLQGFAVETPLGDFLGKLDGVVMDLDTWKVKQLIISPGALKKPVAYNLNDVSKFDEDKHKIIIKPEVMSLPLPEHSTQNAMMLKDLMGKKVVTSDEKKLKSLYDLDFGTKLKGWDVWKLLIQTPIKERRLRISPKDVQAITDTIMLKLSLEEIETREKEAEEGGDA